MLATCSVDTYVHLWDMRSIGHDAQSGNESVAIGTRDMRPESSFCAWTGNGPQFQQFICYIEAKHIFNNATSVL